MRIKIKLQDKREIEAELEQQEYEKLREELIKGGVKFLSFENQLLRTSFIESIEKVPEPISGKFRLPEPEGGLKRVEMAKDMERLFNLLKSRGLFREYENYQHWQEAKAKS
jgi:hypothetical protein